MQSARATWTDERLDDLSARVGRGFEKVDRDICDFRAEIRSGQESLRAEMKTGDESLRAEMITRFSDLERTIRWFGGLMIALLLAALLEGRI